ncbi:MULTISPECIES: ATP-binding cassette domain-containing protein [Lysinibacillus]|uniref:ABC transporter ATP-binding protein n=1 Tax=Lysinibacillus fusiformis TaxID=28031 RepID=A0A2I0UZG2_9BACI|nr:MULTISPECIES: ATP-binding cassette domain-containing protein [Lysinibacillus]PKU51457.1 ABC transporter ATP-binding protein [Lysinibacillus fusiformis]SCY78481.1 ABC-2 type transport system ATP-binding protein [Lysinibacillus sp. SG9]SDB40537.1 ABC-2 type transport system ATP-binding protein [Lysinibacillus sp. TC-37]SFT01427.1 ABC-2 type transport system ATP-binding protein [Lysinibacillus sp. SG55]
MIDIQNITVRFGEMNVLNNISMTFEQGQMIGLVAPNGTGKSTFMNVLMNYVKPLNGKIIFKDGLCYSNKQNEVKIHTFVSMMPDQSDLYNHLSGREHLKMFATMWKSDLKLIDETIEALNMGHYVNKKTGTYSLGMRQRLCFAMQIVTNTDIMMMDEVMNGLDPNNVEIISKILLKKKAEGKIIIIASHLLDNLEKYADRIFLFNEGKLIDTNQIIEDFSQAHIKTIRIKNMESNTKKQLHELYPNIKLQTLTNDMTLIHLPSSEASLLSSLTSFLVERNVVDFAFGKVTLNDLYAMYYHEESNVTAS